MAGACRDVFDYIAMFYNPIRKHAGDGMLSPIEFGRQHKAKAVGVQKTWGGSVGHLALTRVLDADGILPVRDPGALHFTLYRCADMS